MTSKYVKYLEINIAKYAQDQFTENRKLTENLLLFLGENTYYYKGRKSTNTSL